MLLDLAAVAVSARGHKLISTAALEGLPIVMVLRLLHLLILLAVIFAKLAANRHPRLVL